MNNKKTPTIKFGAAEPDGGYSVSFDASYKGKDYTGTIIVDEAGKITIIPADEMPDELFTFVKMQFAVHDDFAKEQPEPLVVNDLTIPITLDDVETTGWNRDFQFEYDGKHFEGAYSYDGDDHQFSIYGEAPSSKNRIRRATVEDIPEEVQDAIEEYVRSYEGNQ